MVFTSLAPSGLLKSKPEERSESNPHLLTKKLVLLLNLSYPNNGIPTLKMMIMMTNTSNSNPKKHSKEQFHVTNNVHMWIRPTDSACQTVLQTKKMIWDLIYTSLSLSASWKKEIMMQVNSPPGKETKSFRRCSGMHENFENIVLWHPVLSARDRLENLELSDLMYLWLTVWHQQAAWSPQPSVSRWGGLTTGEQPPVTIRETKIRKRETLRKFGSVCTSANVAVVNSGVNPTWPYILYRGLNSAVGFRDSLSYSFKIGFLRGTEHWWLLCWCKSYQVWPFQNGAQLCFCPQKRSGGSWNNNSFHKFRSVKLQIFLGLLS